jgi:hypothetical protein
MREDGILRVFPRLTRATPRDEWSTTEEPGLFVPEGAREVHVSCAFTYDLERAELLARSWERTGLPVKLGGPACGSRGEEFAPGQYLADGYVITSRGCPNRCWFCSVWKREGAEVRELPIANGYNVQDDNLLACSEGHIRAVFAMLGRQKKRAEFTGGLEAARLRAWHVDLLAELRPASAFFAYDTPEDLLPLIEAGKLLAEGGYSLARRVMRCYVLMGYPKDTMEAANERMLDAARAGFFPVSMLYRSPKNETPPREWRKFSSLWHYYPISAAMLNDAGLKVTNAPKEKGGRRWEEEV